jgi:hypothetical protein
VGLKMFAFYLVCLSVLFAGCRADPVPDTRTGDPAGQAIIYPSGGAIMFPEEQVIRKKIEVTTQWQTIVFEKPLKINRDGLMGLHLAVIKHPYISTMDRHPLNPVCNEPECAINAACLRRLSDGALVRPEAILVGDNGVDVGVRPNGHLNPFFDKNIITIALRTFKDVYSPSPPFPEGIKAFTAMRIRSTEPFTVQYVWWSVDRHPEIFSR